MLCWRWRRASHLRLSHPSNLGAQEFGVPDVHVMSDLILHQTGYNSNYSEGASTGTLAIYTTWE